MQKDNKFNRILSLVFSLIAVFIVYFLNIPNPMMILIIPVVMFSYIDGYIGGILSGSISVLYSLYFFSNSDKLFTYNSINIQKVITIVLATSSIIFLVGKLKERTLSQAETIKKQNENFIKILNAIDVELKISELKTNRVLYSNNMLSNLYNLDLDYPLSKDEIEIMKNDRSSVKSWEYHDEKNDKWYLITDSLIDWPGSGIARIQQRFDTTESRKQNRRLKDAILLAEESNKAKSDFLSMMSHEIRTPIGVIIGVTEIAQNKYTDDEHNKDFTQINSAAVHLLGIINDILDMSKIEAGKFELSNTGISISSLVKRIKNITMFMFKDKDQVFTIDVDERITSSFLVDVQRLCQVITNLLSNASKFTDPGKEIRLSIKLEEDKKSTMKLLFEVKDNGIGMTSAQVDKLFRPFEQADNSISRRFGGTGLGLAISKNIIDNMNGSIWVESELSIGSVFSFSIPVKKTERIEEKEDEEVDITNIFKGKRILLVEDIEINRVIVKSFLEPTKVKIDEAENGKEALSILEKNIDDYDLVLMDIQMPVMDGYLATENIRKIDKEKARTIPILAMTANVFKKDIQKCMDSGMNAHIGKPIDFSSLINTLKEYL